MAIASAPLNRLKSRALGVLRANDLGRSTKPAPKLYPHQWNWDSAFIAMGLAHHDPPRAQMEIRSLLAGQWSNGMIPHIIFNRDADSYSPGPEWWNVGVSEDAPQTVLTSGITQPPLMAWAAYKIYTHSPDKSVARLFLAEIHDQLVASYQFFRDHRVVDNTGLVCIIHPWESGLDNAPNWDLALEHVSFAPNIGFQRTDTTLIPGSERPTETDYHRYLSLVELFKSHQYSQARIVETCPFLVQPVMFNALLYRDLEALLQLEEILGCSDNQLRDWFEQIKSNFDAKFLNPAAGCYRDYDCRTGTPVAVDTCSGFMPLITDIPASETIRQLVSILTSPDFFWPVTGFPVTSVALDSDDFDLVRYWRGPVWININWLLIQGLTRHGYHRQACDLMEKTIELVRRNGFFEYFHPLTGKGLGAESFSWTASLIIDLVEEYENRPGDNTSQF
jgi:glycogen debranching enzyme